MISFANPAWLWGLIGLAIPIAIHLLSRKEGKTIYIGSIRHLTDSDTTQFSSIRLNEIPLLLLRLILITLLVFILAGLGFSSNESKNKKWLILEKGVEKYSEYKNVIDTLKENGFELHWLTKDLPLLEDSVRTTEFNYYSLIEEIASKRLDSVVVLSFNYSRRLKGERTSLPKHMQWLALEPQETISILRRIKLPGDSTVSRSVTSGLHGTQLSYVKSSSMQLVSPPKSDSNRLQNLDTIKISIVSDKEFAYDRKIIRAALQAIENAIYTKVIVTIANPDSIDDKADFIFWLSSTPHNLKAKKIIAYSQCTNLNLPLIIPKENSLNYCISSSANDWIITQRLTEENVLAENFSYQVAKILTEGAPVRSYVDQFDKRSFADEAMFAEAKSDADRKTVKLATSTTATPILFLLLLFALLTERLVAFKRNQ